VRKGIADVHDVVLLLSVVGVPLDFEALLNTSMVYAPGDVQKR
jgi:hypothetical protein